MRCYECGWPNLQRKRGGGLHCPRCGTRSHSRRSSDDPGEQPSRVVKTYTGILLAWALISPFLVPIIIKLSRLYS